MNTFVPRTLEQLQEEWPPELQHISASSVKMAARCPEQWRQRYVLGRKEPPSAALLRGRSDHAAIERQMRQKIQTENDLPLNEVTQFFVHHFENEIEQAGGVGELQFKDVTALASKKKEVDKLKVDGQRDVGNYHTRVSPLVRPVAVEEEFLLDVKDLPVKVKGYIDLVAHFDGGLKMIDRKGSGRAQYKPQPEWVIQAEVYQLARPLPHEWHITNTKTGGLILPYPYPALRLPVVDKRRAEIMLQQIVAEIGHYMRTYGPEGEWPAKGKLHTWACNFCGFRQDCWGWR